MHYHPDQHEWEQEAALEQFIEEQLRQLSEEPVFAYLAKFGDAIQRRVDTCRSEARALVVAGFYGAALVRAAAGIEITVRFFLARPLVQGAFLSDQWSQVLTSRILNGRAAEDRQLLPAILRNWGLDITSLTLTDGSQVWECIVTRIWPSRNDYVHAGATVTLDDAQAASDCLDQLLAAVVAPIARRLGFTREETDAWSVVLSRFDRHLNPPRRFETASPFHGSD